MNIKPYLPLYLGCEFYLNGVYFDRPMDVWDLVQNEKYENRIIKPILRPLSDMSEEEKTLAGYEPKTVFESAKQIKYLLSIGVDLFGLIKACLAIDKTTLKL